MIQLLKPEEGSIHSDFLEDIAILEAEAVHRKNNEHLYSGYKGSTVLFDGGLGTYLVDVYWTKINDTKDDTMIWDQEKIMAQIFDSLKKNKNVSIDYVGVTFPKITEKDILGKNGFVQESAAKAIYERLLTKFLYDNFTNLIKKTGRTIEREHIFYPIYSKGKWHEEHMTRQNLFENLDDTMIDSEKVIDNNAIENAILDANTACQKYLLNIESF